MSGTFVDGLAVRLPVLSRVQLELMLPDSPDATPCHCGAMVIRVQADGAGLLFDDFSPTAMVMLFQSLDAGVPRRSRSRSASRKGPELSI